VPDRLSSGSAVFSAHVTCSWGRPIPLGEPLVMRKGGTAVTKLLQRANEGLAFTFVTDSVTTKVSARDTNGEYSLMTWIVAPETGAPPHIHRAYDETFYVVNGELEFTVGAESLAIAKGDFVRVPKGTRHAFRNNGKAPVEMLIGLIPGGMEELFYKYRTNGRDFDLAGFIAEAKQLHSTEYELPQ
jgi:mannose-6-phosphate isomerase-like protein (cupin superfamily)